MKKPTKTQRVEKYLNQLMKGRYFKIEDLLSLTAAKLRENTPLLDISQSTISNVLAAFKEKYDPKKGYEKALKPTSPKTSSASDSSGLQPAELASVRQIIGWFNSRQSSDMQEFEDLKAALAGIGMDYRQLLKRYRGTHKSV